MIRQIELKDLDNIISIIKANEKILQQNNRMFYYLCCTVFSRYSFISLIDEKPIGILISFKDSYNKYIWVHQLAILPEFQSHGHGITLIKSFFNKVISDNEAIGEIRLSVRKDNIAAKKMYQKLGFNFIKFDDLLNMEIYYLKI